MNACDRIFYVVVLDLKSFLKEEAATPSQDSGEEQRTNYSWLSQQLDLVVTTTLGPKTSLCQTYFSFSYQEELLSCFPLELIHRMACSDSFIAGSCLLSLKSKILRLNDFR